MARNCKWPGPLWAACLLSLLAIRDSMGSVYGPAPVSITLTGPSPVREGETSYFTITKPVIVPVKIFLQTGGTATWGFDLAPAWVTTNIVIPVGTDRAEIAVRTYNDSYPEETETAILKIIPDPQNYYIVGPDRAVLEILDDDPLLGTNALPTISLKPLPTLMVSAQSNLTLSVSANDPDGEFLLIQFVANDQVVSQTTTWTPRATNVSSIWTNPMTGVQRIYARAVDGRGGVAVSMTNEITVAAAVLPPVLMGTIRADTVITNRVSSSGNERAVAEWDIPPDAMNFEAFVRFQGGFQWWNDAYIFEGGPKLTTNLWGITGEFVSAFAPSIVSPFWELDVTAWAHRMAGRRMGLFLKMDPVDSSGINAHDFQLILVPAGMKARLPRVSWVRNGEPLNFAQGDVVRVRAVIESPDAPVAGWTAKLENSNRTGTQILSSHDEIPAGTNVIEIASTYFSLGLNRLRLYAGTAPKADAISEQLQIYIVPTNNMRLELSASIDGPQLRIETQTSARYGYFYLQSSSDLREWGYVTSYYNFLPTNLMLTNVSGNLFFRIVTGQ